jgi:surface protein
MQVIQINSLTGHSPYDITICDITNTYCYSGLTGVTSVPVTINLPTELLGANEVLVVVTDSIGCQEIQYVQCLITPTPTPTPSITPTVTPTNIGCNCISIKNPSGLTLNFGYTQCDGTLFYGEIYSATTLFVCGSLPYGDSGLTITFTTNVCVNDECPGPTPTPTTTPTPTPTLPSIVGYFQDSCDPSYEFTLSDIPISFSPLSGVYYIESSGFIGCATYVVSSSTNNIYSFVAMGSQPNIYHCQKANFIYPCPTLTPTPSVTPTITPASTLTPTPTPTLTQTNTPTPSMDYRLYQVISCCDKSIVRFMSLPTYFLPGTSVVNTNGECFQIKSFTKSIPVSDYWNQGTTYLDCELCIKYNTCTPPPPPSFISVWVTTTPSESIMLPYETTGSYSGTIDWGDGTTSINSYSNRAHTYTTPGTYTITITGTLIGWSFGVNPISRLKIYEVLQWGCLRLGNSTSYFSNCNNLSLSNVTDILNLTGTNDLFFMFAFCNNITTIPNINSWDTSNVTNMQGMFVECWSFNDDILGWDVSNVTDMGGMFDNTYLFNQPIGSWDVSNVQSISYMFLQNTVFDQDLSSWDVSNVTNMKGVFNGCTSFDNGGSPMISGWTTSNVTNMGDMFAGTPFNQPIGSWDVSNVTKMDFMFAQNIVFDQDLSSWDVSGVIDMSHMFLFATNFNQNLNLWDVSNVVNMEALFWFAYAFNGDVTTWNTSNVTTMKNMFATCSLFNQNISSWNVSGVTTMEGMFVGTTSFNQPIGSWDVSNVISMKNMFGPGAFNQNIGSWNVSNVSNFIGFMNGKSFTDFSTTNLDAIYNGWSSLPSLQSGININFGTIKYTAGGSAGKSILSGTYLWTITDGGI